MKIGKNKHKITNKKTYRKPVMEVLDIDREISLAMVSDPWLPPSTVSSFEDTSDDKPVYEETQQYPKDNSPFGGGTPTYER